MIMYLGMQAVVDYEVRSRAPTDSDYPRIPSKSKSFGQIWISDFNGFQSVKSADSMNSIGHGALWLLWGADLISSSFLAAQKVCETVVDNYSLYSSITMTKILIYFLHIDQMHPRITQISIRIPGLQDFEFEFYQSGRMRSPNLQREGRGKLFSSVALTS